MPEDKDKNKDQEVAQQPELEPVLTPALTPAQPPLQAELTLPIDRTHEGVEVVLEPGYLSPLVAIAADFLIHEKGQTKLRPDELKKLIQDNLDTSGLSGEALNNFQTRIELFKLLRAQTGREIRRELRGFEQCQKHALPDMIAPIYLRERDNFSQFLAALTTGRTSTAALEITPLNEDLKKLAQKPESLYERILLEHNTVAIEAKAKDHLPRFVRDNNPLNYAANYKNPLALASSRKTKIRKPGPVSAPVDKWIPLVTQTFRHAPADLSRALLDSLGFIPEELYTKKAFQSLSFAELAKFHNLLRELQDPREALCGRGEEFHLQRILHARTQLLTHLFLSGIAETVKKPDTNQLTVDVNGLWLNISDGKAELHAHIPFAYITEELSAYLEEKNWLSKTDSHEIRLQKAKNNNDLLEAEKLEKAKTADFALLCESQKAPRTAEEEDFRREAFFREIPQQEAANPECPSLACAQIANLMLENNIVLAQAVVAHGSKIPESAVKYYLNHYFNRILRPEHLEAHKRDKTLRALQLAESIQILTSNELIKEEEANPRLSHDLSSATRKRYQTRQRLLNDAKNYDIARILAAVLEDGTLEPSSEDQFLVFRGDYGEKDGQSHQFMEIIHNGEITRVLINPNKHLSRHQREIFQTLPELTKDQYELIETFVLMYKYFNKQRYVLRAALGGAYVTPEKVNQVMKDINSIAITEFPELFPEFLNSYRNFQYELAKGESKTLMPYISAYFSLVEIMHQQFSGRIFGYSNPARAAMELGVNIRREEVTFDQKFYDGMPEKDEKPWVCDLELSNCGVQTKVVHAEGDRSIPYAMEAKAIRALGLMKDKPLITVFGGCKDTDYSRETESPSTKMARQIFNAAHSYKANVAPPGTQSGFGASASKIWLEYSSNFDHLDSQDKAHCFAVSPGGETWYPGNPQISQDPEREAYAIAPIDSILTPFEAGWNWTGERKAEAPYFHHVEYMEAIYQRVSEGQKRVQVIGNGGLFTIVEAIAGLKNNVPTVLTKDTGRFADLAIGILSNNLDIHGGDIDQAILDVINNKISPEYRDRLLKDFGREIPAEKPEQALYRKHLHEFLLLAQGKKIIISSIDDLDGSIEKALG